MPVKFDELVLPYPGLKTISHEEIEKALTHTKEIRLGAGTIVFEELQLCGGFPFILDGNLKVVKRSESGREITLYTLAVGDVCVVSAACLLGNHPYNAVGECISDCRLAIMPPEDFDRLMAQRKFRDYIFSLFSKRVIGLMQLIDEVAFRKLDQRLAKALLKTDRPLRASHQDLADELGTARELVTRILNDFAERKLVQLGRQNIRILDRSRLKETAGE